MKIAAVILAAGSSSRFGQPKALLKWQGKTLLERACRVAKESGHSPILVITAPDGPLKNKDIPAYAQRLDNPLHHLGMGTSLALAANHLVEGDPDAFTVLFPDQPAITAQNLQTLKAILSTPETSIVLADSGTHTGPPAIFAKEHFPALSQLTGDHGGKKIAEDFPERTQRCFIPEAIWDIDTPDIWQDFCAKNEDPT